MYVDGLLAENHGTATTGFDPLLSEPTGTADTPYLTQPYWPTPDPLPTSGSHLAYLDVWQREVTHLESPDLVEVAVGVDTTARWQTVWQVRVLAEDIGGGSCGSDDKDIPGWLAVIRPSDGRLWHDRCRSDGRSLRAPAVERLPRSGRTRPTGLRITPAARPAPRPSSGRATTARSPSLSSRWSRRRCASLPVGRDDVLRISTGDWVEILDDHYELGQRPGVMRKVTVDDAARTITFAGALPADLQPANATDALKRHLRVRRWDQSGIVRDGTGAQVTDLDAAGSTGLIATPTSATTQIVLEHGVVASFSIAPGGSGSFRSGDYWIVAARTSDTSVEVLDAAPPLGIHHHYARLAIVDLDPQERRLPRGPAACRREAAAASRSEMARRASVSSARSGRGRLRRGDRWRARLPPAGRLRTARERCHRLERSRRQWLRRHVSGGRG